MNNVLSMAGAMTPEQYRAFVDLAMGLDEQLMMAKSTGLMQGVIVGLLHAIAHRETAEMLDK